jgi:hypothetical protein
MSLQNYDINVAPNRTQEVSAQGRYLYYYEGTTPNITAGVALATSKNQQIKVTAGTTGASVLLMPGQSIRLAADETSPSMWKITNANGVEVITGNLLIGEGEFHDSNVSNTIKLDATFANNVKVTNDLAARVPVQLDPNAVINVAGNTVQFTHSYSDSTMAAATQVVINPAQNVNGAYVEFCDLAIANVANDSDGGSVTLVLKTSAPANQTDGAVILAAVTGYSSSTNGFSCLSVHEKLTNRIKLPAGMGLYMVQTGLLVAVKSVLYTIL